VQKDNNGLLNSRKAPRASRLNCQKKKVFQILFFSNSDRDFCSENNNA
jgi:hypothetical protein